MKSILNSKKHTNHTTDKLHKISDGQHDCEFVFVPLGGTDEIGNNLYIYGYGKEDDRDWIIVDFGISFCDEKHLGVDVILPDISFLYKIKDNIKALLITHAHEDHFGALIYLWENFNIPIYASAFSAKIIESKYSDRDEKPPEIIELRDDVEVDLGKFKVEVFFMNHSIPDALALFIKTSAGNIFHSGDWRIDNDPVIGSPLNDKYFANILKAGCDGLICDSTNIFVDKCEITENHVRQALEEVILEASNRVVVTSFTSNIGRVISIINAAKKANRKVMLLGVSIERVVRAAVKAKLLDLHGIVIDAREFKHYKADEILIFCTGCQGEGRSVLSRIANSNHRYVKLDKGDSVIFSSKVIPGNENNVFRIENNLSKLGVNIINIKSHNNIHVSGHPSRYEVGQLYDWLMPKMVIPMHGESRHLIEHAEFAKSRNFKSIYLKKGDMVCLHNECMNIIDNIEIEEYCLDGKLVKLLKGNEINKRRKLGYVGVIFISLVFDNANKLASDIEIRNLGVQFDDDNNYDKLISTLVNEVIKDVGISAIDDSEYLKSKVSIAVRHKINKIWGKKPFCEVVISYL